MIQGINTVFGKFLQVPATGYIDTPATVTEVVQGSRPFGDDSGMKEPGMDGSDQPDAVAVGSDVVGHGQAVQGGAFDVAGVTPPALGYQQVAEVKLLEPLYILAYQLPELATFWHQLCPLFAFHYLGPRKGRRSPGAGVHVVSSSSIDRDRPPKVASALGLAGLSVPRLLSSMFTGSRYQLALLLRRWDTKFRQDLLVMLSQLGGRLIKPGLALGKLDWIEYRELSKGADAFKEIHDGTCSAPKIILIP